MSNFNENKAVAQLTAIVAIECGVHSSVTTRLRTVAFLHDIGKQKIPAAVLNKPGKLDAREFEVIKTHTALGADMLSSIQGECGEMVRTICRYHHEWWNGGGYWGKYPCELPAYLPAVSISDVFVALLSERPYKHAWPKNEALDYIQSKAGTQFSPALVKVFLSLVRNDGRVSALFSNI